MVEMRLNAFALRASPTYRSSLVGLTISCFLSFFVSEVLEADV